MKNRTRTKRTTKKAFNPKPIKGLEQRPMTRDEAAEALCQHMGTGLVRASDMVAELYAQNHMNGSEGLLMCLGDLLELLWNMRWELHLIPDNLRVAPTVLREMAIRFEAAANAQPAEGGAS